MSFVEGFSTTHAAGEQDSQDKVTALINQIIPPHAL
jgi:hypothetical protein